MGPVIQRLAPQPISVPHENCTNTQKNNNFGADLVPANEQHSIRCVAARIRSDAIDECQNGGAAVCCVGGDAIVAVVEVNSPAKRACGVELSV